MATKRLSGAANRKRRRELGLPPYRMRDGQSRIVRADGIQAHINSIKLSRGCTDCGYNAHSEALDFDHLPGFEKISKVAALARALASVRRIDAEIAKCEVVCANCHRVRTANRRKPGASQPRQIKDVTGEAGA